MTAEQYVSIFDELGIYDHRGAPNRHKTLKHPGVDLPSLYFNRNRSGLIYFTAKLYDREYFPENHWARIPDYLLKRKDNGLLNIVATEGRERRAFVSLIESANIR